MNDNIENRIPVDLIARVLSGEANSSERARLKEWESKTEENSKILQQYSNLWKRSGELTLIDDIDVNNEWDKFISGRNLKITRVKGFRSLTPLTKLVAAILVGAIIGFSALATFNSIKYENITAIAEVTDIILPDGTKAILYPGSGLKYPKKFRADRRNVKLEGEAFFNVVRDPLKTFTVSAGDMVVKVLGTSFNVEAYKSSDRYSVIVEEGHVAVFSNKDLEAITNLLPGDKATFSPTQNTILSSVNDNINFNAWRTGKIIFEDSDLSEIAATLSKVFMKDIEARSNSEDQRLTATFESKSLEYILETIEATLDISIDENDEKIIMQ